MLLVETREGVPIDIALGGLPFEARVIARSTLFVSEPGEAPDIATAAIVKGRQILVGVHSR